MANITKEERARRDAEDKANNLNPNPLAGNSANLREPNFPVLPGREGPHLRGDYGYAEGRAGTIAPLTEEEKAEDEAKVLKPELGQMQMFKMKLKHGFFLEEGVKTARGEEIEVPQDRARQLFEDGIAEFVVEIPA